MFILVFPVEIMGRVGTIVYHTFLLILINILNAAVEIMGFEP